VIPISASAYCSDKRNEMNNSHWPAVAKGAFVAKDREERETTIQLRKFLRRTGNEFRLFPEEKSAAGSCFPRPSSREETGAT
jgi:hypothetical protein